MFVESLESVSMLKTKLDVIGSLTDPAAIANQLKLLNNQEAVYIAFYCAVEWVDNGDFMEQIMSALNVPKQAQDNFSDRGFFSMQNKEVIEFAHSAIASGRMLRPEYSAWGVLRLCRAMATVMDYKRIGILTNMALKQMEVKA